MRNPGYYFTNPFDSKNISVAELEDFSIDHLNRLITHNENGDWTSRIAATTPKLTGVSDSQSTNQNQLASRAVAVRGKDEFRKEILKEAGKVVNIIAAEFGEDSLEVQRAIPQGRTVFSQVKDNVLDEHLITLRDGAQEVSASIPAKFVTLAEDLVTNWTALYNASEMAITEKSLTEEQRRTARADLQLELFLTLLELAKAFPNQPEQMGNFMRPALLGGPTLTPGTGGGGTGEPSDGGSSDGSEDESDSSDESVSESSEASAPSSSTSSFDPPFSSSTSSFDPPFSSSTSSFNPPSSSTSSQEPPPSSSSSNGV